MALDRRAVSLNDDELKETTKEYKKVVLAKELKRVLETRLLILNSDSNHLPGKSSNITKLELGLTEAINSLQKVAMEHQILNVALQKSITSTLLSVSRKNFLLCNNLNYLEKEVSVQMRNIVTYSNVIRDYKDLIDQQYMQAFKLRNNITSKFASTYQKLNRIPNPSISDDELITRNKLNKKIENINKLQILMSILVMSSCDHSTKSMLINLLVKWSTHRTFQYYYELCQAA